MSPSYFVLICLLLKGLHSIASSGQTPYDPTSYLNLLIRLVFSVLNCSLENICLWLRRNLVQSEGNGWRTTSEHREPAMKQAWTSQNCVGCVRELSNYSRTHGSFYPHCCFLAPPTKVNSKPWSSSRIFLICFLICYMHLSSTLKWFFPASSFNRVLLCGLFGFWFWFWF